MILAIDTSTAACTAALFDGDGACLASRDELIGRGHSERLVPMIAEMLDGRTADRILVGVGPGSFTGIRVGIAAAQGLAIGWDAAIHGMSSLALIAAGWTGETEVAAIMDGGHGELFLQQFAAATLEPTSEILNLPPDRAAESLSAPVSVGPAAARLAGTCETAELWPSASNAMRLPQELRSLTPKPVYARAPDAKVRAA